MSAEKSRGGRFLLIGVPYLWMLVFFLVPFLIVAKISLSTSIIALPPYTPVIRTLSDFFSKIGEFSFFNYLRLVQESIYVESYLQSLWVAASSTVIMLFIAYPLAYGMARAPKAWRPTLLMLVILPFWTSFLIRVYAWIGILADEGLLNSFLMWAGIVDEPITFLATQRAVYIGIIYSYLPFMVLPLYSSLEKMDETLLEAAQDLGCTPFQAFWRVTFPLSIPGVIAGSLLVFIPAVGEFVIPDLLGGSDTVMIGKTLWEEFFNNRDWPEASAVAITLLIFLVVPIVIFQNAQEKAQEAER
ncbi:MAG: ABC transporter permease subunit [Phyllobacteriaceae bacterium]|nr:ABC transporter permease subunit [Phyllobacteriaceae bacterium]